MVNANPRSSCDRTLRTTSAGRPDLVAIRRREVIASRERDFNRLPMKRPDILLVCQPGGHLSELLALETLWGTRSRAWFTLRSTDTESALLGERVFYGFGPTPRSVYRLALNSVVAAIILLRLRPRWIITTGAALAVPTAWIGRALGAKTIYIECGGRVRDVSLSMRLIAPVAHSLYVQWPEQERALKRAKFRGRIEPPVTIEAPHATVASEGKAPGPVVATVGTTPYPFDRFVELVDKLGASTPVLLQTGVSRRRAQNAVSIDFLEPARLAEACAEARAIVTHGGVGSVWLAWRAGLRPIVIPRRMSLGENVDDHQLPFVQRLEDLGLVEVVEDLDQLRDRVACACRAPNGLLAQDSRLVAEIATLLSSAAPDARA